MKFSYANPTKLFFGQGRIKDITKAIPNGARVLFAYGGGSIKRNGIYEQVCHALAPFTVVEFSGIESNPSQQTMDQAVALIREHQLDFILAVGGGSVIDGCKYACAAAQYEGNGWDIMTGAHRVDKALPLGAVLTLPATGSESNSAAVLSNPNLNAKLSFLSPHVYPQFAVMDPDVIKTLPERQVANGLVDAFVHVCEQYLTYPTEAAVQEGYAEVLLRNLVALGSTFDQRDNDTWRANFMLCCNQALNGFIGSGVPQDWATHMIGHEITALYGVEHARSLAIVQPAMLKVLIDAKRAKLEQMGRNVFMLKDCPELASHCIDVIEQFYLSLQLATRLRDEVVNSTDASEHLLHQLEQHGLQQLGEKGTVDLMTSQKILSLAI